MKFTINNLTTNPTTALRRAGYRFQRHAGAGEMSFVHPMGRGGYPRFHVYVTMDGTTMHLSIHIDHTKHTHGTMTRHGGEYDGDGALGTEVERLKHLLK